MPIEQQDPFTALSALGAGEFSHLNGSLEQHLSAVRALLESWGADKTLCDAGLYHAAYGTAGFTAAMVSPNQRSKIAHIIGDCSEGIVYRYCSCDRSIVWPQIGKAETVQFHNRFTTSYDPINNEELRQFCELTCANEIEIAISDEVFVERAGGYLGALFRGWSDYLSKSALRAVDEIFLSR